MNREVGKNQGNSQVSNLFPWIWSPFFVVVASHLLKETLLPCICPTFHVAQALLFDHMSYRLLPPMTSPSPSKMLQLLRLKRLNKSEAFPQLANVCCFYLLYSLQHVCLFLGSCWSKSESIAIIICCSILHHKRTWTKKRQKSFRICQSCQCVTVSQKITTVSSNHELILIQPQHGIGFSFIFTSHQLSLVETC